MVVIRWLWPRNMTFLEMVSMVVTWWIVAFLCSERRSISLWWISFSTNYNIIGTIEQFLPNTWLSFMSHQVIIWNGASKWLRLKYKKVILRNWPWNIQKLTLENGIWCYLQNWNEIFKRQYLYKKNTQWLAKCTRIVINTAFVLSTNFTRSVK